MNEKFLTRGMLEDTKDWVVGYFVESPDNVPGIYDFNGKFNKIIPETAGRYINIDDKEGRRIFEGDIVTAKRADENIVGIVGEGRIKRNAERGTYHLLLRFRG